MRLYWSDREGNPPPAHCTFSFRPFFSKMDTAPHQLQTHLPAPISVKILKKSFLPTKDVWDLWIKKALQEIQKGALQKVVLARTCTLELERAPDPFALCSALKQKSQGAFVFCIQSPTFAFLGATPERLFVRKGRNILSEAVAGTRKRGKTEKEDLLLEKELLQSKKDLREFFPVQSYLQTSLSPLCTHPVAFSATKIHKTQNVQHLYSQCHGLLKEGVSDEEILTELHPTPALCGAPKQKAFSLIKELEPFERGLYGGVVGWSTPENSEWIVGIRSCLLSGKTATLFSGTGIVEGSDPDKEWDELNQKLKIYDSIFID